MYLHAVTLGCAVPDGNFDSTVHSVFHSAINLRLAERDHLLTLVLSSEPDLPQGIRLDTPDDFSFEKFQIGEAAICWDGILHFESSHLSVRLSNARRWKCDLSRLEINMGNPAASASWRRVWEVLNQRQKRLHAEIVAEDLLCTTRKTTSRVSSKAAKAIQEIVGATQQLNSVPAVAVEVLIGLGSGLTPSGDDLLTGYMTGLWCTVGKSTDRAQFITELGKRIIELSVRTNDISRTYLFHAVHGQVSSRLAALAEAIGHGDKTDHLLETAEHAMQTGSTSGMDTAAGLLVGISAWKPLAV